MYYAASIALIMLHPNLITLMNTAHDAGQTVKFLKYIPVTYASYSYSVIPIILAVYSLRYVERFVDKITPVVTKNFLKPMLVVLIEAPIALIILGPLGAICGNGLSTVVYAIHDKLGFIAIGLVAGVYPFVVMAGMHHAFTPIKLGMIATQDMRTLSVSENYVLIWHRVQPPLQLHFEAKTKTLNRSQDLLRFQHYLLVSQNLHFMV